MGKINKRALVISIILALAGATILYQYISSLKQPVIEKPKVTILIAARNIEPGEEVKSVDILEKQVDPESVGARGYTDREEIEGRIVKLPIIAGEVFPKERLALREEMQLSYQIPEGKRAMNLFVNESALFSDLIQVGDHIDIIGTVTADGEDEATKQFITTFMQNIEILAIGINKIKDNPKEPSPEELAKTITLAVTPQEAETLMFISTYGQYSFILREKGDATVIQSDGVIAEDMIPKRARSESGE